MDQTSEDPANDQGQDTSNEKDNGKPYERTVQSLKKSDLFLLETGLVKNDADGGVIARFELADIKQFRADKRFNNFSILLFFLGIALILTGFFAVNPNGWAWVLYGVGAAISAFSTLVIYEDILRVDVEGTTLSYVIIEEPDDLSAFVFGANKYLAKQRGNTAD